MSVLKLPWRKQRREPPTPDAISDAIASSKEATAEAREATDAVLELTERIKQNGRIE